MNSIATLGISDGLQGNLVVAATLIFLLFAAYGLVVGAHSQESADSSRADTATTARAKRVPVGPIAVISGLVGGLAILAIAGC